MPPQAWPLRRARRRSEVALPRRSRHAPALVAAGHSHRRAHCDACARRSAAETVAAFDRCPPISALSRGFGSVVAVTAATRPVTEAPVGRVEHLYSAASSDPDPRQQEIALRACRQDHAILGIHRLTDARAGRDKRSRRQGRAAGQRFQLYALQNQGGGPTSGLEADRLRQPDPLDCGRVLRPGGAEDRQEGGDKDSRPAHPCSMLIVADIRNGWKADAPRVSRRMRYAA